MSGTGERGKGRERLRPGLRGATRRIESKLPVMLDGKRQLVTRARYDELLAAGADIVVVSPHGEGR